MLRNSRLIGPFPSIHDAVVLSAAPMSAPDLTALIGPEMAQALAKKGYERLTPVQEAVLRADLSDRDLRISSQTGSGKTLAIGFAIRAAVGARPEKSVAAMIITPTRELAQQVERELSWLYGPQRAYVAVVTGGAPYREEMRSLAMSPAIVVGTPGRLLDHLKSKSVDPAHVAAVVLDEADRMLDMGFREELESIFKFLPTERRTHLVSATFPRELRRLADKLQNDAVAVEGTPLGQVNQDIDHVLSIVDAKERVNAIINLLLAHPGQPALIFTKMRADVTEITRSLSSAGFNVLGLSGAMEQRERNRSLAAFRNGRVQALIATDVAARGIDVQDIARVIQIDPPTDPDTYIHRAGRTGRAGKLGESVMFVAPNAASRMGRLVEAAGVKYRFAPIPPADGILEQAAGKIAEELLAPKEETEVTEPRLQDIAKTIARSDKAEIAIARLLARANVWGPTEPRQVTAFDPPSVSAPRARKSAPGLARAPEESGAPPRRPHDDSAWVAFRVSWGGEKGADPRRVLALVCRRGNITRNEVGPIQVARRFTLVNVLAEAAADFEQAAKEPDERDPLVRITRMDPQDMPPPPAKGRGPFRPGPGPRFGGGGPRGGGGRPDPYHTDRRPHPGAAAGSGRDKRPPPRGGDRPPPPPARGSRPGARATAPVPPARASRPGARPAPPPARGSRPGGKPTKS